MYYVKNTYNVNDYLNCPYKQRRHSAALTNLFATSFRLSLSVKSLCTCNTIKEFNLSCPIVFLRALYSPQDTEERF